MMFDKIFTFVLLSGFSHVHVVQPTGPSHAATPAERKISKPVREIIHEKQQQNPLRGRLPPILLPEKATNFVNAVRRQQVLSPTEQQHVFENGDGEWLVSNEADGSLSAQVDADNSKSTEESYAQVEAESSDKRASATNKEEKVKTDDELAQPIRPGSLPNTLNEIYSPENLLKSHAGDLYAIKFYKDFERFDPRSRSNVSEWTFRGTSIKHPQLNVAFFKRAKRVDDQGGTVDADQQWKENLADGVDMVSVPFNNWLPQNDDFVDMSYYEGSVRLKPNISDYSVSNTQKLLVRYKFTCKTQDTDKHPFPKHLVTDPLDDYRLAHCAVHLTHIEERLSFQILATNKGVWATYSNLFGHASQKANSAALSFKVARKIGLRKSYHDIIDVAIEYDGRMNVANYYLNGVKVWSIFAVGTLPPFDGINVFAMGQGTEMPIAPPISFRVHLDTGKSLDDPDPNNPISQERLVKILPDEYLNYAKNSTFFDPKSSRSNSLWGQSAILTVIKMKRLVFCSTTMSPHYDIFGREYAVSGKLNDVNRTPRMGKITDKHIGTAANSTYWLTRKPQQVLAGVQKT